MTPADAEVILGELASVFLKNHSPSSTSTEGSDRQLQADVDTDLPRRESLYKLLIEQIPAVVFIAYLDGGIGETYVSPQVETALGFTQEEWLEDPIRWYRQVHPDDKERWSVDAAKMFATGTSLRSSYRVIARDGRVVWFQCEIRMIRREDGRPWFIHGVGFDISDLKRTEEELQQYTAALHHLSSRLFRLQDEERRRIARELHDSLGQYLSALKINLDMLEQSGGPPDSRFYAETQELIQKCIAETRTLSHLLHPPLLDEMGFRSAAQWYVDGFAKRSGINVTLNIPAELERLPDPVEIALFRVLQETLTNVHRHSRSSAAEIQVVLGKSDVSLEVKDYGCGIPPSLLERFEQTGTGAGIGFAGMRERARELGGYFQIRSDDHGTSVSVTIPLGPRL